MTWLENATLAIVEGLTEYLPVSSTGHLMMFKEWMKLEGNQLDTYMISIQFGAIFAVVVLYWKRFFNQNWFSFYSKLIVGFLPAAVLGFLFDDILEQMLQTPMIVAIMLIVVGTFLIFMDKILLPGNKEIDDISYIDSFIIGMVQTIAMIPGTSRSAATIAGGLGCKLTKSAATEFSFFLAIPTLSAAAAYKILKNWDQLSASNLSEIAIGNVISFITAALAVKFFIGMVKSRGFSFFGYYRIIIGTIFLITLYL